MNLAALNLGDAELKELEELLAREPVLREHLAAVLDPPEKEAVRHLSLVSWFDKPLYDGVFRANLADLPAFSELVTSPDIEPVPGRANRYAVRSAAQSRWLAEWKDKPEERALWARQAHDWLREHDAAGPVELLALRLAADPAAALAELRSQFERADAADNFVVCHALVELLEAAMDAIPANQRAEFRGLVARQRTRAMFLPEFYRTAKYFPRETAEAAFNKVVHGPGDPWIVYLSAEGGMGKTTFIQWTIANRLLKTAPYPLVCRIDLDHVEIATLATVPWLVTILLARALDPQLPTPLFGASPSGFVDQVERYEPLLHKRQYERGRQVSDERYVALLDQARHFPDLWDAFVGRCTELPRDRPLVIFIDTLEEATLHYPEPFRKLLQNFEALRAKVPNLRLVLSGRYGPDQFPQYETLRRHTLPVTIERLREPDEVGAFVRLLAPALASDAEMLDAIIATGHGTPFKLAILCDMVAHDPSMTPDGLRACKDADLAYLIKRVVDRIPLSELGLRWLLRYGMIPRRLTYSFVKDVLHPLLINALKGELEATKDDVPSETERQIWLNKRAAELEPPQLWRQLTKYDGARWMSLDSGDPETVAFHPDVVRPMRELLRNQGVYNQLHREAAKHFAVMKKEPGRWLDSTLGELYHCLELGDDILGPVRNAFAERPQQRDAGLRRELAQAITRSDGDFVKTSPAVKAWAHCEAAHAIAALADFELLPAGPTRVELARLLGLAIDQANEDNFRLPNFPFTWRSYLEGEDPGTLSALLKLWRRDREERAYQWLLLVELCREGKVPLRPVRALAQLFRIFPFLIATQRLSPAAWQRRYAEALLEHASYAVAIELYKAALPSLTDDDAAHRQRIRRGLVKAMISGRNLDAAERELAAWEAEGTASAKTSAAQGDEATDERAFLSAEIHLLRRDAWAALDCLNTVRTDDYPKLRLKGIAAGQLLRIDEAVEAFSRAAQLCSARSDAIGADQCRCDELQFRIFEARLEVPPESPRRGGSGPALELELLRAYQLRENPNVVAPILARLAERRQPIDIRIRAMLAELAWGLMPSGLMPSDTVSALRRGLLDVAPREARLALATPPVTSRKPGARSVKALDRWTLGPAFRPARRSAWGPMRWVIFAQVLSALGNERGAVRALARIRLGDNPTANELAVHRQRRLAESSAEADPIGLWEGLSSEPGLHIAVLTENAERALGAGDLALARASVDRAAAAAKEADGLHPVLLKRLDDAEVALSQAEPPPPAPSASTTAAESPPDTSDVGVPGPIEPPCVVLSTDAGRLIVERPGYSRELLSTAENDVLRIIADAPADRTPLRLASYMIERWPEALRELAEPFFALYANPAPKPAPIFLAAREARLVATPWELGAPPEWWLVRLPLETLNAAQGIGFSVLVGHGDALTGRPYPDSPEIAVYVDPKCHLSYGAFIKTAFPVGDVAASYADSIEHAGKADILVLHTVVEEVASLPQPHITTGETGEVLGRMISAIRGRGNRPFVVLSTEVASGSTIAGIEQLLARNRFAQTLADSGAVSGVLATGLFSGGDVDAAADRGLSVLTETPTLIELPHRLTPADRDRFSADPATLARTSVALFLAPPEGRAFA